MFVAKRRNEGERHLVCSFATMIQTMVSVFLIAVQKQFIHRCSILNKKAIPNHATSFSGFMSGLFWFYISVPCILNFDNLVSVQWHDFESALAGNDENMKIERT